MRKSAYYSRNNSYSRSYNAQLAEEEGRYPLTRAAKELGVSTKIFKEACKIADIETNEWHHVGKYANRVDYWDTVEIGNNIHFWLAVKKLYKNKKLKQYAKEQIKPLVRDWLFEKLAEKTPMIQKNPKFAKALIEACEGKGKLLSVLTTKLDTRGERGSVYVRTGETVREERIAEFRGRFYVQGYDNVACGGYIMPFNLKNLNEVIRKISLEKFERFKQKQKNNFCWMTSTKERNYMIVKILERKIRGKHHNNSLLSATREDYEKAAKIVENLYADSFYVERNESGIFILETEKVVAI